SHFRGRECSDRRTVEGFDLSHPFSRRSKGLLWRMPLARGTGGSIFLRSLLSYKPVLFVFEENIKCSQRSINAGNVLLKIYLILIAEFLMSIYILLQHP